MTAAAITEDDIVRALQTVIDPEVGVNVYDLGLIYAVTVDGARVQVSMTMTTPACPMGSLLTGQVRDALAKLPGIRDVDVALTWQPAWTPALMSAEAKRQLGWPDE